MDIPVFNEDGGQVGVVTIDEKLLGEKVRTKLLHQAIIRYEANLRVGTHKTKSKAERHGSGLKPFKQKHTGRARAGMPAARPRQRLRAGSRELPPWPCREAGSSRIRRHGDG